MPQTPSRPTITPSFPEFLPPWVSRQPWYRGSGVPRLAMAGAFRLEDPAGEVGLEVQLLRAGGTVYQVPLAYRGAPRPDASPEALIVTAEHSELGPRWIYDAETDPVWRAELLRFVRDGDAAALRSRDGVVDDAVRGRALDAALLPAVADADVTIGTGVTIEIRRVLPSRQSAAEPVPAGAAGLLTATYRPGTGAVAGAGDRDMDTVTAFLAVIR
jgi:hypothetical protein